MKKPSIFSRILYWVNILVAVATLLAYLAPYVSPTTFWPMAFFGLAYPILLLLNSLFFLFWGIRKRWYFLLSLVTIVVGWGTLRQTVRLFNSAPEANPNAQQLEVMSFNVRLFDLYSWTKNSTTKNRIFETLSETKPDVMCFQEYYHSKDKHYYNTTDTLNEIFDQWSFHMEYTVALRDSFYFGMATYSKFPIANRGHVKFDENFNNLFMWTDVLVGSDTVRVFNVHLASIHFDKKGRSFVDLMNDTTGGRWAGPKLIGEKLKTAFERRANQAEMIARTIRESPYPVIVCGDFNDVASSYAYATLSEGLQDTFMEAGSGLGISYNGKYPAFRIDYILHDERFRAINHRVIRRDLSDHFPIVATLEME